MSDSRSEDDRPVEEGTPGATSPSPVPPAPPTPPGPGPDAPWATGPPHDRPPAGYGTPEAYAGQYSAATPPPQNGTGTAALVLGIVGVFFAVLFFPLGFVLAVAGLVFGIVGLRKARRGLATNRGVALAGTLLSVLALIICIGWGVLVGVLIDKTRDCNDPDLSRGEQRQCIEDELGGFAR
jgi:hypothetical protein